MQYWFKNLLRGIAEDNGDIVGLLGAHEPWPKSAQRRFVRATLWSYTFAERGEDGAWPSTWWRREKIGDYSTPFVLEVGGQAREGFHKLSRRESFEAAAS